MPDQGIRPDWGALSLLGLLVAVAHVVTLYLSLLGFVFLVPWTLRSL